MHRARALIIVLLVSVTAVAEEPTAKQLQPSEALHKLIQLRLGSTGQNPQTAGKEILDGTQKQGLSSDEEVALSVAYFLAFFPKEADVLAAKHLEQDDMAGRVSWQMHGRMLFRAFQRNEEGRALISQFRKKFKVTPDDLIHSSWLAYDSADVYREQRDYDKAVTEILDDFKTVPIDKPYRTFDALGGLYEAFEKAGKKQVAIEWMKRHRDALRRWLRDSGYKGPEEKLQQDTSSPHRPGVLHFNPFPGGLNEDAPGFQREALLQRVAASQIEKFNRWIAAAEKGEKLPPI